MVLWANFNALILMRAAIGSQCKLMNRGVMCVLFGSLKINLAAAFWTICRGLKVWVCRGLNKSLNKELWSMFWKKGPNLPILYKANLQDQAVLATWSEKFSLSSITTPSILAVFEGVTFTFTFMHLADAFIQSDLHSVHSGYTFVLSVCVFPGNRTHNLCAADAML